VNLTRQGINMSRICKHEFEQEDPFNKGYSLQEYDLYAKTGLAIRKNLKSNKFELVNIKSKEVKYTGTLEKIVAISNKLEGKENTWIECSAYCSRKKRQVIECAKE